MEAVFLVCHGVPLGRRLKCAPVTGRSCWWAMTAVNSAHRHPMAWPDVCSGRQREISVAMYLCSLPRGAAGLQTAVRTCEGREELVGHSNCGFCPSAHNGLAARLCGSAWWFHFHHHFGPNSDLSSSQVRNDIFMEAVFLVCHGVPLGRRLQCAPVTGRSCWWAMTAVNSVHRHPMAWPGVSPAHWGAARNTSRNVFMQLTTGCRWAADCSANLRREGGAGRPWRLWFLPLGTQHCFWQVSDFVCTTVLTVTLSRKEKPRFARFFDAIHKKKPRFARFLFWTAHQKIENNLETSDNQTNVVDLTMRTLVTHTNTDRQTDR